LCVGNRSAPLASKKRCLLKASESGGEKEHPKKDVPCEKASGKEGTERGKHFRDSEGKTGREMSSACWNATKKTGGSRRGGQKKKGRFVFCGGTGPR